MSTTPEHSQDRPTQDRHLPVLLERCLDLLAPALEAPGAVLVDATLGLGGHSEGALARFPGLRVIGIDRDTEALALATARLAPYADRFTGVHATYDEIDEVVAEHAGGEVAGVLMDLGVSSLQLDETDRGFSYAHDAPLDMRMDATTGPTAADLLATLDERELRRILRTYGEEKFAPRLAAEIVRRRETAPLRTTADLVDVVDTAMPAAGRRTGGNPAKRTFQALRIAVNGELDILADALPRAVEALAVGGRIVVESYQSLEDRLVKAELARGAVTSAPPDLPVVPETHQPYLRLLTRGAEEADEVELAGNSRSRAVRLRAAERLRPTPDHLARTDRDARTDRAARTARAARTDRDVRTNRTASTDRPTAARPTSAPAARPRSTR
ncbi:16S rRNA (cytosine(1402)-N(4))-methyltransferase RsmH [Georgenia sp. Z1344]|uniref:16S rRNA (cytosine(1402)-N(4))-methyltransferase RsmH n=1 Tax=Georgenia sp. Z1344 TaxID=3416706 RepID=UPI003CF4C13B